MRKIEFLKTVTCDGRTFQAGDVVAAESLALDHVATCLRLGHAREVPELVPLTGGRAVLVPEARDLPSHVPNEVRAAVAEIERLRGLLTERTAAAVEVTSLRARVAELEAAAKKPSEPEKATEPEPVKPTAPVEVAVEPEHPPAPEPKAKPPVVGPSKPPELKGGRK